MSGGVSERHLNVRILEILARKCKFITYLYTKVNSLVQAIPSGYRAVFWYQIKAQTMYYVEKLQLNHYLAQRLMYNSCKGDRISKKIV